MKQSTTHPLAQPTHARIDINYGSDQREVIADSVKLVRHAITHLSAGEYILYLNTAASHRRVEEVMDSISVRHAAKVKTYSESGADLIEHLPMLTKMIEDKQVRIIILNSLDFATVTSKQRKQLVHWLRKMRDEFDVRVIVYTMNQPARFGATGQLAWIADTIEETSERAKPQAINIELPANNANLALEEELMEVLTLPMTEEKVTTNFVDVPLNYNDLRARRANVALASAGELPAKTRELEYA